MTWRKRGLQIVIFSFIFVYFCANAQAVIGISPGSYEIDFKPSHKQTFRFNIIGDDNMKFRLAAEGALAQYVTVSPRSLDKPGSVQVILSLPESLEQFPGENIIYISAKQQPAGGGGIQLLGNVKGVIKIKVPYPEEFAKASITASNANVGEPVHMTVTVDNLGTKDISTKVTINIFNSANKSVASIPLGIKDLVSLSSEIIDTQINTEGYLSGYYRAEVVAEYGEGKVAKGDALFRLGEFFVNITGHSNDFNRNVLNKLDIVIENFWSDPIEKVYANVSIINYSQINLITSFVDLEGFGKATLSGYFDTSGIIEDEFDAKVIVHYGNETTDKILHLRFKKEKQSKLIYYLAGILIALLIILSIIWAIARRVKKHGRKGK